MKISNQYLEKFVIFTLLLICNGRSKANVYNWKLNY